MLATLKHTLAMVSRSIRRRNTLCHFTFEVWLYKIYEGLAWALLKDMQNILWYGWSKPNNVFCHCPQLGLCHCCHRPILGIIVRYFANVIIVTVLDLQFLTVMCRLCTRSWLKVVLTQDAIESKVFAAGMVPWFVMLRKPRYAGGVFVGNKTGAPTLSSRLPCPPRTFNCHGAVAQRTAHFEGKCQVPPGN